MHVLDLGKEQALERNGFGGFGHMWVRREQGNGKSGAAMGQMSRWERDSKDNNCHQGAAGASVARYQTKEMMCFLMRARTIPFVATALLISSLRAEKHDWVNLRTFDLPSIVFVAAHHRNHVLNYRPNRFQSHPLSSCSWPDGWCWRSWRPERGCCCFVQRSEAGS